MELRNWIFERSNKYTKIYWVGCRASENTMQLGSRVCLGFSCVVWCGSLKFGIFFENIVQKMFKFNNLCLMENVLNLPCLFLSWKLFIQHNKMSSTTTTKKKNIACSIQRNFQWIESTRLVANPQYSMWKMQTFSKSHSHREYKKREEQIKNILTFH